jgi:hypothetical protein
MGLVDVELDVLQKLVLRDCGPDIAPSTRKPRHDVAARVARLPVSARTWAWSWTS